ncbi:unnamed protein product [Adineta steineri]|uniref:Zinc-binding loop region of homing endonuclease domain-containing protein n=1 Tax=Adineta steineri TaxID=433720 RepID=A0A814YFH5_9BILA|nr:unnamed protein product [Adineta steineri]
MKKRIAKNPYPIRADEEQMMADTGLSLDVINIKIKRIRTQSKKEKMMVTLEGKEVKDERGAGQYFLSIISTNNAIKLYNIMMKRDNYEEFINDQHIKPELSKEQLEIMTGSKPHDGSYFAKWLSCLATKQEFLSVHDALITLWRNSQVYSVVKEQINQTCKEYNTRSISILKHHIVLRTKENLPVLSTRAQGSHLCDSNGCVLKEHIVLESYEMNISRRDCEGMILSIIPATTKSPPHIKMATSCRHGVNYKDSNGDDFLYSCRKIQCVYLDEFSVAFLNE